MDKKINLIKDLRFKTEIIRQKVPSSFLIFHLNILPSEIHCTSKRTTHALFDVTE